LQRSLGRRRSLFSLAVMTPREILLCDFAHKEFRCRRQYPAFRLTLVRAKLPGRSAPHFSVTGRRQITDWTLTNGVRTGFAMLALKFQSRITGINCFLSSSPSFLKL